MIQITNKITGEIHQYADDSHEAILHTWREAQELERVAKSIKDKLRDSVKASVDHRGVSEPLEGYQFRVSRVQRMQYDVGTLRRLLDEDLYQTLVKPDKTAIDNYIKANVEDLGSVASEIRQNMIEDGAPYEIVKLEKIA